MSESSSTPKDFLVGCMCGCSILMLEEVGDGDMWLGVYERTPPQVVGFISRLRHAYGVLTGQSRCHDIVLGKEAVIEFKRRFGISEIVKKDFPVVVVNNISVVPDFPLGQQEING